MSESISTLLAVVIVAVVLSVCWVILSLRGRRDLKIRMTGLGLSLDVSLTDIGRRPTVTCPAKGGA